MEKWSTRRLPGLYCFRSPTMNEINWGGTIGFNHLSKVCPVIMIDKHFFYFLHSSSDSIAKSNPINGKVVLISWLVNIQDVSMLNFALKLLTFSTAVNKILTTNQKLINLQFPKKINTFTHSPCDKMLTSFVITSDQNFSFHSRHFIQFYEDWTLVKSWQ